MDRNLSSILSELHFPVLICTNRESLPILYGNAAAELLFSPFNEDLVRELAMHTLKDLLEPEGEETAGNFCHALNKTGQLIDQIVWVKNSARSPQPMSLSLKIMLDGDVLACFLPSRNSNGVGFEIINSMRLNEGAAQAISSVLEVAGNQAQVSRVYIFEELSHTTIRNTYEWCAPRIEPMIQKLQNEEKRAYNYNELEVYGRYILEDVRTIPQGDREIFEAQEIKATIAMTLYEGGAPIGYVGFDDCVSYRRWDEDEIRFLETIASLVSNLLIRRNSEEKSRLTQEILQLMNDHSDDYVYVRDLEDYTIKFVSKTAGEMLGKDMGELIGKPCREVMCLTQEGGCTHCPIDKIAWKAGQKKSDVYVWEHYSDVLGKHFLIKSSIVIWVDGKPAYIARATDITRQVDAQKTLRFYASMDMLLGIYNRLWGERLLLKKIQDPAAKGSLCFVDVDGLKKVNDTLGHQAGDQLLIESVALMKAHLPGNEILCRWGGDEFLIWAPQPVEEIEKLFEAMDQDMNRVNSKGGRAFPLAFSYGVIPFESGEGASLDAMITMADERMYQKKMRKKKILLNWLG